MKNSIPRRSFLKKSAVGAVAAANASLLSGLVNAFEESGPCNGKFGKHISVYTANSAEGDTWPSAEEAQAAAEFVQPMVVDQNPNKRFEDVPVPPPCTRLSDEDAEVEIRTITTPNIIDDAFYTWTKTTTATVHYCVRDAT